MDRAFPGLPKLGNRPRIVNPARDDNPDGDKTGSVDPALDPRQGVGATFGRYERVEFIGNGGMGVVFKAYDPTLGRSVALKLILGTDDRLARRLLLEAKAQARIEHDNVCRVYDAGVEGGRPFIAMQFIEGPTLPGLEEKLGLEQTLQLMRDVALGVHAAHRAGLVHRDLKPSNVMVERQDDGRWHPYVMDFGLAREVGAPGATATSFVIGTPWYMSPEQAVGAQDIDRRSDVYSLGASLYDILGGEPPFGRESNVVSVTKLLSEEPPALRARNPALPRDVETIVMKCLEKDPSRRYDSARALAEDIGRFLDSEPIAARPPNLGYRLYTRARKHVAIVAVGGIAFALALALAIAGLRARAAARRQVELAAEFSGTVRDVEWRMRVAHLAPLHDVAADKARLRADLRMIEARMLAVGELALGPGEYALGRGQLILEDPDGARRHLEKAWANGYRRPGVAYALGLALGKIYERELTLADGIGNHALREAKRREIQTSLRDPAIGYLRQSAGFDVASPAYVEALLAFYARRYGDALARVAAIRDQAPWLYEANLLEGDVESVESRERHESGDDTGSREASSAAERAYGEAARYARSDPAAFEGLCQIGLQRMEIAFYAGGDLAAVYESSKQACATALSSDSERAEVYAKLSNLHRFWADHLETAGSDPQGPLDLALESGRRALGLDPLNRRAHGNLGILYRLEAEHAVRHGESGSRFLDEAFRSLQKAVDLSGGDANSVNDLGNAYATRAAAEREKGGDPRADVTRAVAEYDLALNRVPDYGYAFGNRGIVLTERARYEMDHGIDPEPTFREAVRSLERFVELLPKLDAAHATLADTHCWRARFELKRGLDPAPDLAAGRRKLEDARRLNPRPDPDSLVTAGRLSLVEAERLLDTGQTAARALDDARRAFRGAAARDPKLVEASRGSGEVELLEARAANLGRRDPRAAVTRAVAAFEGAIRKSPRDVLANLGVAEAHLAAARWLLSKGMTPDTEVGAGLAAISRALDIQGSLASALAVKGALLLCAAEASPGSLQRRQLAGEADETLGRAIAIDAYLGRTWDGERQRIRTLVGAK